jgi:hypothetical protein
MSHASCKAPDLRMTDKNTKLLDLILSYDRADDNESVMESNAEP